MSAVSTLVVYAHPAVSRSRVNRTMLQAIHDLPAIRIHDLYAHYPDFDVDVAGEQAALAEVNQLVLQYPIHWYAAPALLKQWLDGVLTEGWAYGRGQQALRGKRCLVAVSTGGLQASYHETGRNGFPFDIFLRPMEQTARLCGMVWQPPLVLHGADRCSDTELATHAARYRALLSVPSLRQERV